MNPLLAASTRLAFVTCLAFAAGCTGSVDTDASSDTAVNDASADTTGDTTITPDVAMESGTDAASDTAPVDAAADVTPDLPPVDAGCAFDGTYSYGNEGGHVAWTDSTSLAPAASWTRTRMPAAGPNISCMQTVPCGTSGLLDVNAVMAAILNQDVQSALQQPIPPLYGRDSRPVDGSVFVFRRVSDGRSFMVGDDCGGAAGCNPIPAGVASLVTTLRNLDTQELALTGCEALR